MTQLHWWTMARPGLYDLDHCAVGQFHVGQALFSEPSQKVFLESLVKSLSGANWAQFAHVHCGVYSLELF